VSLRVVHLPDALTVALDVAAWGAAHAGTGYLAHRLPAAWLARDRWWFRPRRWESERFYRRTLRIARWKDRVPEAGALFAGGVSKRHVTGDGEGGLDRFVIETRRAEVGHTLCALCGPLFVLWNPPGAAALLVAYGVGVNAPFVAIQRYNRMRAGRVLAARARRARGTSGSSMP
jgi:glycosyl-4,4'-diaponeurosporenoate acyltransferase